MTDVDQVADLLKARLDELDAERRRVEDALAALTERPGDRQGPDRSKASAAARRKTGGRAPRGQRREQVLRHLAEAGNAKPAELAREIGVSASQVQGVLRSLRDAGLVRKFRGGGYGLTSRGRGNGKG